MVSPFLPLAVGGLGVSSIAKLYSQANQRKFYNYQRQGYDRQLKDWNRNVGVQGRQIRYPELSYQGKIRGLETGIENSYASSLSSLSGSIGAGSTILRKYLG